MIAKNWSCPAMTSISTTAETLEQLAAGLRQVLENSERVVIGNNGQPAAALIPYEDLQLLERLIEEEEDRIDLDAYRRVKADIEAGRTKFIPWEEAEARLDQLKD